MAVLSATPEAKVIDEEFPAMVEGVLAGKARQYRTTEEKKNSRKSLKAVNGRTLMNRYKVAHYS